MVFMQAAPAQGNLFQALLPFIILFGVFYFVLLRPQQQQQKKRREMLSQLNKGDKIVTVGGIQGTITAIKDDTLIVRIAEKVEVTMNRSGIAGVRGEE